MITELSNLSTLRVNVTKEYSNSCTLRVSVIKEYSNSSTPKGMNVVEYTTYSYVFAVIDWFCKLAMYDELSACVCVCVCVWLRFVLRFGERRG